MAAVSGNKWTLALAKQTAKGTVNATPTYKLKATGGNIMPIRDTIQLAETDATRQQGSTVVVGARVEGTPEHYLRPGDFGLQAYALMGGISTSGSTTFTHVITPADTGPYFTLYKAIGSTSVVDRYQDCRVTSMTVNGEAGGVLTVAPTWYGMATLFGTTDPVLTPVSETPLVYPNVVVTRGGSAPGNVENFSIEYDNGGEGLQGDGSLFPYDYVWGELSVSGTLTALFEDDADYRRYFTGTTTGTQFTTTVASQTLNIKASINANLYVEFVFAGVALTSYEIGPDPGGSPIRAAIGFRSLPQTLISDYAKINVVNAVSSY